MALATQAARLAVLLALFCAAPDPAVGAIGDFDASFGGEPVTIREAAERGLVIRRAGEAILALPAGASRGAAFRELASRIAATGSEEVAVAALNLLARGWFLEGGADEVRAAVLAAEAGLSARAEGEPRDHRRRCAADALSWRTAAPKAAPAPWPGPEALPGLVDLVLQGEWGRAFGLAEATPILAIPDEDTAGRILSAFWQRQRHAEKLLTLVRPAERLGRMLTEVAVMMSDTRDQKSLEACERVLRRGAIHSGVLTPDEAFEAMGPALLLAMEAGTQDPVAWRSALLLAEIPSLLSIRALIKAVREGVIDPNVLERAGHPEAAEELLALLEGADQLATPAIIRALGNCGASGKAAVRKLLEDLPGYVIVGLETFCPLVDCRQDFELVELAAVRFESEWRELHGGFRAEPDLVARMWRVIRGRTTYCAANPAAARAAVDFLDLHPGARIEPALFDILRNWPPPLVAPVLEDLARSRPNEKELIRELRQRQAGEK